MTGVSIRIDVDAKALRGGLAALERAGGDMRDAWDVIGRRWVDLTKDRFEEGVAPDGTPWKPSRRAEVEGGQTLVQKGMLRDSLTHEADADGVTIGTNLVYAAVHQKGATIVPVTAKRLRFFVPGVGQVFAKKVTIPPRPFIGANDAYMEEFAGIVAARLRRVVSAAGGEGAAP